MTTHDDLGFVEDKHDDLGFVQDVALPEEMSTLKATALGAAKGASLSFADEIAGALGAAPKLSSFDINKIKESYNKNRQEYQALEKQGEEEHPYATFAGELAGGVALPLGALGAAGKAATLGQKLAASAKLGGTLGGAVGLGQTEDITDVGQTAKDVAGGALMGAVAAPVIDLGVNTIGSGIKDGTKLITENFDLPKNIKKGFERGKEGVNILKEKELYSKAKGDVKTLLLPELEAEQTLAKQATEEAEQAFQRKKTDIDATKRIIIGKEEQALAEQRQIALKKLEEKEAAANKELLKLSSDVDEAAATQKKLAKASKYENEKELANDIVDQSKQLQINLKKVKDKMSPEFATLDDKLTKGNITVDMNPGIEKALAKASEYKIDIPISKLPGVAVTEDGIQIASKVSPKELRVFKNTIQEMIKEAQGKQENRLASSLREIVSDINGQLDEKVTALGDKALSDEYTILNNKRANLFRLEELIDKLNLDPVTGETLTGNKTIGAVKSFLSETNPTQIDLAQDVRRYIKAAAPEEAEQIISPLQQLAQKQRQIEMFSPEVDKSVLPQQKLLEQRKTEIEDLLRKTREQTQSMPTKLGLEEKAAHPELLKLEEQKLALTPPEAVTSKIVDRALGRGATQKPIIEEDATNLTKLLARSVNKGANEEKLIKDELLDLMQNTKGQESIQQLEQSMSDYNLSQVARKKAMLKQSGVLGYLGSTAEAGATIASNVVGLGVNKFVNSEAFYTQIPRYTAEFAKRGMTKYANMLEKIGAAPLQKQRALTYTLLQDPSFRNTLKEITPGLKDDK